MGNVVEPVVEPGDCDFLRIRRISQDLDTFSLNSTYQLLAATPG